jgi:hypothetical protein
MQRAIVTNTPPTTLLSYVPSRPFFPRGFLWDEGFHLLPVIEWDLDLAVSILQSWLSRMDDDGWIERKSLRTDLLFGEDSVFVGGRLTMDRRTNSRRGGTKQSPQEVPNPISSLCQPPNPGVTTPQNHFQDHEGVRVSGPRICLHCK